MNSSLTVRITPTELQSIKQLMSYLRRRTMSDLMHYLIADATEKILPNNYSMEQIASSRRTRGRPRRLEAGARDGEEERRRQEALAQVRRLTDEGVIQPVPPPIYPYMPNPFDPEGRNENRQDH